MSMIIPRLCQYSSSTQFAWPIKLIGRTGKWDLDLKKKGCGPPQEWVQRGLDLRKRGLDLRKRSLDLRKRGLDYYFWPKLIWRTHDFVNTVRQHNLLCPAEGPGPPEERPGPPEERPEPPEERPGPPEERPGLLLLPRANVALPRLCQYSSSTPFAFVPQCDHCKPTSWSCDCAWPTHVNSTIRADFAQKHGILKCP